MEVKEIDHARYERKFLSPTTDHAAFSAWLALRKTRFHEAYPPRWINNLYLDTPTLSHYQDHLAGIARRKKVRIRWYGSLDSPVQACLELKIKHGLVGVKHRFPLPPIDFHQDMDLTPSLCLADADLPPDIRLTVLDLEPSLINRYRRRYYETHSGRFRLTWDTGIQFFSPGRGFQPAAHQPEQAILELKYARDDDGRADRITREFPYRLTRFSKYVSGVEALADQYLLRL